MLNVFQKLIQNEFGKSSYYKFSLLSNKYYENKYLNDINHAKDEKDYNEKVQQYNSWLIPIYEDIIGKIRERDKESIDKMRNSLYETVQLGIQIRENFIPGMLFFLSAVLLVYIQNPKTIITWGGILLMSLCFVYKTVEYLINKYCLVDRKIIMIYKLALDTIYILEELEENEENE